MRVWKSGVLPRQNAQQGRENLPNRSLRSRTAWLLAGGCCSSLFAAAFPSQAFAQTADQTVPGDPNAPQPATAPGDVGAQPPADQGGSIVITGIRRSLQDSINIKRRERGTVE